MFEMPRIKDMKENRSGLECSDSAGESLESVFFCPGDAKDKCLVVLVVLCVIDFHREINLRIRKYCRVVSSAGGQSFEPSKVSTQVISGYT